MNCKHIYVPEVRVTPITENGTQGVSSFASSGTKDRAPGPPETLAVSYAGSDFIELEWDEPVASPQCVRGVATMCQQTQEKVSGPECAPGLRRGMRGGRVNHLEACTRYECWAAYPAPEVNMSVKVTLNIHELSVARFLDCEQFLCGDNLGKGSGHFKSVNICYPR